MTGKRISELAAVSAPLTLQETLPTVQDGATKRISIEQVRGGRIVSVRDFGAVGDGVADDTAAFQAMHARLLDEQRKDPEGRAVILIPPGHYRYTWNRWLWGLRDVTVEGYGARLQCVASSKWNFEKFPLVTNRNGFQTMAPDATVQPRLANTGSLIETAAPGAASVRLKDQADAPRFIPGRYVLVMSYDQQFAGYPPNCRYFDYAKVVRLEGTAMVLDRPLRHHHRDDYPELSEDSVGRARIFDIDRDDVPFSIRQTLLGLTFLPNPNVDEETAQYLLAQGVYSFVARDCTIVSFVASIGHDFSVDNSTIAYSEPDKLVETLTFSGCRITALTQATGVNLLVARDCTFATKANVQARVITFDGCTFTGAAQPGDYQRGVDMVGFAPIKTLNILNSTFYGKSGETDAAVGPIDTPSNGFAAISLAAPIRIVAGRVLAIPLTDKRAQTLLRSADPGDCIWVGAQAGGDLYCDGRHAVITSIKASEADVVIEMTFSAPIAATDMLIVPRAQRLRCVGNAYRGLPTRVPVTCHSTFEGAVLNSEIFTFRCMSDFVQDTRSVYGAARAVSITVLRPYTGADSGAFLRIEQRFPANPAFLQVVDLREKGRRRVVLHGPTVGRPSDMLADLVADQFMWSVRLSHAQTPNGRSAVPAGAGLDLADYLVSFEMDNPFRLIG